MMKRGSTPFFLLIFNFLFQITISISRFLGFHVNTISALSENTHLDASHPSPTDVDPPVDESGQEETALAKRTPPPPPPSNGGGGQTN
ncbi:hypothetical protein SDJN03_14566, partial [Cucurbita argyrosperma subsp. sororia]